MDASIPGVTSGIGSWLILMEAGLGSDLALLVYPGGVSPTGAYDCAGNVWEWCADLYDESQTGRVLRGGAFLFNEDFASCVARNGVSPSGGYFSVGFRVVVSPIL